VRDAVDELVAQLPGVRETTFRSLNGDGAEPLVVIVRFLAVLELYKEGLVDLDQGENFGELRVRWLGEDVETLTIEEYQG
jgi:segregation and condensation protein A